MNTSDLNFKKGIEGDYLETKKDHLFFDIKGVHHPKDRKICFIRFYPDPDGDREKNGIKYKKIYDLNERYSFLKIHHPKYLFHSEQFDLELQGVKNEDILKIYTPRDYYAELNIKKGLSRLEKCSLELCELFIAEGNLPEGSIGITGSPMIGINKDHSDIDIMIYGTDTSLNFQQTLPDIIKNRNNFCREYTLEEYQVHYDWRVGGSDIPFDNFLQCERRKLHQGMYKGFEFFIRYLKSPRDWQGDYDDYQYKDLGRIKVKATIINSNDSIFTPCSYKINVSAIIKNDSIVNDIKMQDIIEVNSFRGRFCEHALEGENVLVEGKLESVIYKDTKNYFRILLSDQVHDKMMSA